MVKVEVICPSCSKIGNIEVSEELLKNVTRGLLAINIAGKKICPHSFIVYVDKNLFIRDYFMVDFHIELPKLIPEEEIEVEKTLPADLINIEYIKFNLPASLMTNVLRSIFLKKKILLISDQVVSYNHALSFFKNITQNSFNIEISIRTKEYYIDNEKNYQNHMVFEGTKIIRTVNKIIEPKKLKVEKQLVNNFLTEHDLTTSLIILRNNIQKTYEISLLIVEYIKKQKKGKRLYSMNIIKYLEKVHNIKISVQYLNFLTDVIRSYFEIPLNLHLSNVSSLW